MTRRLTDEGKSFLRLVYRSLNDDGWANVSNQLWPMTQRVVEKYPTLIIIDKEHQRVKLTLAGRTVVEWL